MLVLHAREGKDMGKEKFKRDIQILIFASEEGKEWKGMGRDLCDARTYT